MVRNIFTLLPIIFIFQVLNSKPLEISGLNKLSINDLQMLSNIDITKNNFEIYEIEQIINDLYSSDLIYDVILKNSNENFLITIQENTLIENIFFLNNRWINDNALSSVINSKKK